MFKGLQAQETGQGRMPTIMHSAKPKRLVVTVSDVLSAIVRKGELTPRYYNPGGLFDEVHIMATNDDRVDSSDIQMTVGRAKLFLYNIPLPRRTFIRSLGYRPFLLKHWARTGIRLARQIRPDLIRCYGNSFNGFLGAEMKHALGTRMIVSLHSHPEETETEVLDWKLRLAARMHKAIEDMTLQSADAVLPVYRSLGSYAERHGAKNVQVVYNVLNSHLGRKRSYELHDPVRIISVGRLYAGKNPENIIRAVADLDAHLTLVGDGPLVEYLKGVTRECGAEHKATFHRAISNDELCEMLPEFDIFAAHSAYSGPPKAVLEPLLTGLPVVLNRCDDRPCPEVLEGEGKWVLLVKNDKEGYLQAFRRLIADDRFREQLGREAYVHAQKHWAPDQMEAKVVRLYSQLMHDPFGA
jgi:glycosyltransferase involved in cell wall biosynthesis